MVLAARRGDFSTAAKIESQFAGEQVAGAATVYGVARAAPYITNGTLTFLRVEAETVGDGIASILNPSGTGTRNVVRTTGAEQANAVMRAQGMDPSWMPGTQVTVEVLPVGSRMKMVVSEGQADAIARGIPAYGGFATIDDVPSRYFAKNDLAITREFKKDVSHIVEPETTKPMFVESGTDGPQGSLGGVAHINIDSCRRSQATS